MAYQTINPATGETVKTFTDISDAALADESLKPRTPAMNRTGDIAQSWPVQK